MGDTPLSVVGIGADGWAGLPQTSRDALCAAEVLLGGPRQLDLLPAEVAGERREWPSPLVPALPGILGELDGRRTTVLASGDPMFFGIGATLARLAGPERLRVLPHPSSVSLACARLGWGSEQVRVLSVVGRPLDALRRALAPGARLVVLSAGAGSPAQIAALLTGAGWGGSRLTVLERLGAGDERILTGTAAGWRGDCDPLNVVAVECVADDGLRPPGETPGLPDDAYEHDGQLTKREIRAVTLARLAPRPGELLWDVGAGSGSIGIEWLRAHPACRAIAVESRPERADRVARNAAALGVPGLRVVIGRAPDALAGLPQPDVIFVGGGLTRAGVLDACLGALRPGGRLVANAVTVQTEAMLAASHAEHGGDLVRLQVARAEPLGPATAGAGFHGWRPAMPVTIWTYEKGDAP
ncbi:MULTISPECIES: precorrin-6y C5,15-methyltransferase (decarboxylating) subunit CbiE [Pseudonocardia]|uniref:Precorrin-6Y C(5,15)-methyltransferase [decarboxylating] n=2 Tax=Pseudonocardia TaxID=1847 RepID=A0A1Y2N6V2_PSEAH|nr:MULTISPECIES: precorrin-6y C5,15-methyltransferase (decarboxylating) subunit CbiE [Pseudonocardia]OSY43194.1 Precorrin-6Y C(5,15)-methyltransferase [decarboxylating] [Pseudonocardia autotrophica]TDN71682.1 precorrin-6Y C5,15-methyltransferase (decarboxylating) [Pseudonocardia autotrophica]BBG02369.1 precorrin-6Y C5,15-methyltransferase (decarboxylating) [Pseudonocardia autotrophica]GEC23295.1 precorrin-6Y C5,15-methyltransferase (decarboxylating) [Pseudonocardia saturnea]